MGCSLEWPSNSAELGSTIFGLLYLVGNLPIPTLVTDPHSEALATPNTWFATLAQCHNKREDRFPDYEGSISCQTPLPTPKVLAIMTTVYSAPESLERGEGERLNLF